MTNIVINLPDDAPPVAIRNLVEALGAAVGHAQDRASTSPMAGQTYTDSPRYAWRKVATALREAQLVADQFAQATRVKVQCACGDTYAGADEAEHFATKPHVWADIPPHLRGLRPESIGGVAA